VKLLSQNNRVAIDKKDKEFDPNKLPIINLINSILKTMEEIQWHMSHNNKEEGGSYMTALFLLTSAENRVSIPETEKQLLADRERLNYNSQFSVIKTREIQPMINRFNQYLLSELFAEQHGIFFQNKTPRHIGE